EAGGANLAYVPRSEVVDGRVYGPQREEGTDRFLLLLSKELHKCWAAPSGAERCLNLHVVRPSVPWPLTAGARSTAEEDQGLPGGRGHLPFHDGYRDLGRHRACAPRAPP